ncbi:DUF6252 family protein [Pontimicrobium aquaticum]|uniref:Uncharacterized protein n=1 Tax=Pontimicrobium aquaticum TaxID=2565367 RepID=A0A4U0F0Q1_9FLAO|nr:DUF6252 family protein [Pontimicrobium aquaticum]TJY37946.1 hypothetical protein E5167_01435 [Pontimicrobium aquaticum]
MKRIVVSFLIVFLLLNCSDEIRFNSPALQASKQNELWRSNFFAADIDNGGFVIEGRFSGETIQLITTSDARGTFSLGLESDNVAIFKDVDGTIYSTKNAPDPSLGSYPTSGEIIVEDIDNDDPKNVYGTFWFYAYTADGLKVINFNKGVFYKVPLTGGLLQIQ